jgi:two-component system response regulator VicR
MTTDQGPKILVVDDEKPIVDILTYNLKKEGYAVCSAVTGQEALEKVDSEKPDLVVLDIMLPKIDGFMVCQKIRRTSNVPILLLTAKQEEVDKVLGLELGADDYVTKPFSPRELLARIRALLRRASQPPWLEPGEEDSQDGRSSSADHEPVKSASTLAGLLEPVQVGDLIIDPNSYEVRCKDKTAYLSHREFQLLRFLAAHAGQIFTRQILLDEVWGYEYFGDTRTVDVTIRRLREKVEGNPSKPEYIMTKRGVGYYFKRM